MKLPPGFPTTHHELTAFYHTQYDASIKEGRHEPFVYPWGTLGAAVVVAYLLIPHRNSRLLRRARFLVFAWIAGFAAYTIRCCRSRNMAPAFGTGIISAWSVLWVATILVVNDAQLDFQRIERLEGTQGRSRNVEQNGVLKETEQHGKEDTQSVANGFSGGSYGTVSKEEHLGPGKRHGGFAWQPYPLSPFIERLDWVLDIFCNFRGMGWNWRIPGLPPPPKWVQEQLRENSGSDASQRDMRARHSGMTRVYQTRAELLRTNLKTFILGYLILDLLKVIVNHDPYFWGLMDRPPPAYLPTLLTTSPILLRFYRLAISQYLIKWSLQTVFSLAPLFFSGVLGPHLIGARAAPWMYPDTWGSYAHVLDRGLAGWWAGWWHQTFRFAFSEPARKLVAIAGLDPRSLPAKLIQLATAFALSGFLHACGSYTQPGPTRPLRGPFCFFVLQVVGIAAETLLAGALKRSGVPGRLPKWFKRLARFVYVHAWFYHTAPLLADDFAKGGLWLYEPVPISPLRALGFGVSGDGWWCWAGQWVYLYRGDRWWKSGVAF